MACGSRFWLVQPGQHDHQVGVPLLERHLPDTGRQGAERPGSSPAHRSGPPRPRAGRWSGRRSRPARRGGRTSAGMRAGCACGSRPSRADGGCAAVEVLHVRPVEGQRLPVGAPRLDREKDLVTSGQLGQIGLDECDIVPHRLGRTPLEVQQRHPLHHAVPSSRVRRTNHLFMYGVPSARKKICCRGVLRRKSM